MAAPAGQLTSGGREGRLNRLSRLNRLNRLNGLNRRSGRSGRRMARRLLAAASVIALTATPLLADPLAAHAQTGYSSVVLNAFEARLVADVNAARTADGLGRLQVAAGTTEVARSWADHLAAVGVLSHNPNLLADLEAHGSPDWTFAAENVGYGPASDADTLFTAYMNSPEHRANILAPQARFIGMGAVAGANGLEFNTMDFVDSYSGALAGAAAAPRAPQIRRVASTPVRSAPVRRAPAFPLAVYPDAGVRYFTAAASNGSWAGRPYLAASPLGTVVRFVGRAGQVRSAGHASGVYFVQHAPVSLAGQSQLRMRVAGQNRLGRSTAAEVVVDTPRGWVALGFVPLQPATRWVSVPIPAAYRSVALRTELYLPARWIASVGGTEVISFGPELG